ncbi:MAG: pyridoxal phosphate-dependent aminotransferase [Gammaproteobacteria bacterium]
MFEKIADRMRDIAPFYVMELLQRAKQLEQQGRNVIHMEIGEPDFATPETVIEAGIEFLRRGAVKYTPAAGLPELRERIAAFYRRCYAVSVPIERIFVTPGASGAFLLAFAASLNAGDDVLMADPCYPCNSNFLRLFGAEPVYVGVDAATRYQLNAALIRRYWTSRSRGALVASPSNPTGTLIGAADLQAAVNAVKSQGGCFYSDEIYHGLVYSGTAASAVQFGDESFVINSFSKYFGMTGWRIGWLIVPEAFCPSVEKLAQNIFISTSAHSQYAALAAFEDSALQELERRRLEFEKRRDYLYEALLQLGFGIACKPDGAFYIYADCSSFSDDSFRFAKDLLEVEAVAVTPGIDFGRQKASSHIRFAYTTSLKNLQEGVRRLQQFINRG